MDLLFGKYGLPQQVLQGQDMFKDLNSCPDQIKQHLEQYYNQEVDRLQMEQAKEAAEAEARSRHSSQQYSLPEIQLDLE